MQVAYTDMSTHAHIHADDVAWSPSGKEFVVVYGFMPAKATLFDVKCKPVFDYGTGARNTVCTCTCTCMYVYVYIYIYLGTHRNMKFSSKSVHVCMYVYVIK